MTRLYPLLILPLLVWSITVSRPAEAESFTFVVWSDSHYGYADTLGYRNNCIDDINDLAGKALPPPFTGIVGPPAFVVHGGDITQNGLLSEWENTTPNTNDDYVSGRARLHYPIYEVMGNHDHRAPDIRPKFVQEHGNPWYSFDYGGVHFLMLDSLDGGSFDLPFFGAEQLAWITADLAAVGTSRPVIVVMHFPPYDDATNPFGLLANTLAGYNIVVILHGHEHETLRSVWRGWDVWGTGDNQYIEPNPFSTISAVRIVRGRLQAVAYNWYLNIWYPVLYLEKPITGLPPGTPRIFLQPGELVFTAPFGSDPAPGAFTVTNVGDSTLEYAITDDSGWIHISPESGSSVDESDTIQVTCDAAGLMPGIYTGTITVADSNAGNSPQSLSVRMEVMPVRGDLDADGDVDLTDFGRLQTCFSGFGVVQNDPVCHDAHLDLDADVDQYDVLILVRCLSGAGVPVDPQCGAMP